MTISPQPKPVRGQRKNRIDYTDPSLALRKAAPDRDADYLRFVRGQTCAAWSTDCEGHTEAAHLEVFGRGIKASDFYTAPLCSFHHALQHRVGIDTFQMNEGVNLWMCSARLLVIWIRRGCK